MPVRADAPPRAAGRGDAEVRGPSRPGRRRVAGIVLAVATTLTLVTALAVALHGPVNRPSPAVPAAPSPVPDAVSTTSTARPAADVRATTLDVPALRISGSVLIDLGVDASGALVPPSTTAVAGWFRGSAAPGDVGPTVIAGHVDSYKGPGIFFHLDDLKPGDLVTVGRSDGRTFRYRVTDVLIVPKTEFPTDRVYGPTPGPELRLITCGGEFDHSARRYLRNVVVSGVLDGDYPDPP